MFKPSIAVIFTGILAAQTPLENTGKPMRVAYECTAAETQAAGLGCSEKEPCPVYLELSHVESAGSEIFITGNIHTSMATLDSILLASEDGGKSWTEPHTRIRQAGLDQIQFVDAQHGWISGANLQGAPRDPFFLTTNDGGKTWTEHAVFGEDRVAGIEEFRFDSAAHGTATIDARLDGGAIEAYGTNDGGNTWARENVLDSAVRSGSSPSWRLRTDTATHSYVIEKSENGRWQKLAGFLVNIASCKE